MLVMFRVKNFASFKDEVILDLRAVSYKEMTSHVLDIGKNKLVKTLAIYGKNASGKSNLVSALYYFESFIFNQFINEGYREDDIKQAEKMPNIRRTTYRLSEVINEESEFEIVFYHNNKTYQYGFSIKDEDGKNKYYINEEWLLVDDKEVFDRNAEHIMLGKKYEKDLKKIDKVRNDRLYLGTLDYFADGNVKLIIDGFKDYLKHNFNVYFELIVEMSIKGFVSDRVFLSRLVEDERYRKTIEQFIKVADIGINRLEIEENFMKNYDVKTIHNVYNNKGEVIREEKFDLNMESSGTIWYFCFIQYILNMIENGGVFIVDEMSARLHPMLTKFIVDLYQSERNKKAQLIFTTHDVSLMNRQQFRRDEIAFVDKNKKGESSIFTLADIKTRSDASFSKDYMFGKYGAIPVIDEQFLDKEMAGDWLWED